MAIPGLIPTNAVDVVGVFTQAFQQVFQDARPIKAVIKPLSKLMQHPVEDGTTITDNRIVLPVEIELSLILLPENYKNTYQQIEQYYNDATLLTVQTRVKSYPKQLIAELPHEEDAEMFDTIAVALKLQEVQFVTPQNGLVPKNPSNNPTTDRGTQQGKTADEGKSTTSLIDVHDWVFGK